MNLQEFLSSGKQLIHWNIKPKDLWIVPTINNIKLDNDAIDYVTEHERYDGVFHLETVEGALYYATGGGLVFDSSHKRVV